MKIKKTPIVDEFDPSLTKTELSGKDLIMDGELPMRNGRICEHDSPDDDDSYIGNKGKCTARTVCVRGLAVRNSARACSH